MIEDLLANDHDLIAADRVRPDGGSVHGVPVIETDLGDVGQVAGGMRDTVLQQVLPSAGYGAIVQLLVTRVPVRYPSWMGAYAGYPSDGAMILRRLRGDISTSRG